jgi:hypothetical protein
MTDPKYTSWQVVDIISGRCEHTLSGHTDAITCIAVHMPYILTGSRDASVKVWSSRFSPSLPQPPSCQVSWQLGYCYCYCYCYCYDMVTVMGTVMVTVTVTLTVTVTVTVMVISGPIFHTMMLARINDSISTPFGLNMTLQNEPNFMFTTGV